MKTPELKVRYVIVSLLLLAVQVVEASVPELMTPDQKAERLSQSALDLGQLSDVEQDLLSIVKESPTSSKAHYWLGRIYVLEGKPEKAVRHFRKSVGFDPANFKTRVELAKSLASINEYEEAKSQLTFILRVYPGFELALYELASIYMMQDKLVEASSQYLTLIRINPSHPKASDALAKLNILYHRQAEKLVDEISISG